MLRREFFMVVVVMKLISIVEMFLLCFLSVSFG